MTNQQHLDLLKQGIAVWNEWRERHPNIQPDLSETNLSGMHLEGANLNKANFKRANLTGAYLDKSNLTRAQLRGTLLIEAYLDEANLNEAQLEGANLTKARLNRAKLIGAHLKDASLLEVQLEDADLFGAQLQGAHLIRANLKGANLFEAHLEEANLFEAHLEGAQLIEAHFQGANLKGTYLDMAHLEKVTIGNDKYIGSWLADVHWGETSLAAIQWSQVKMLGEEYQAREKKQNGKKKDGATRLDEYEVAVRANRQLAVILYSQGLSEYASHFAYHAQILQKHIFCLQMIQRRMKFRQRVQKLGGWLFSWFLFLLAGYGYKPQRSFCWYLIIISSFSVAYTLFGHLPLAPDSFIFSIMSFHGRGFFPNLKNETSLHDPLVMLAAMEAVVGLFIEISFIATFTQRFFGR